MKTKTHGHYYADIQFIGRDIRVEVIRTKFDKDIDGMQGTGWIAKVNDKPISNDFDFSITKHHQKKDCIAMAKKLLARAYSRKMRDEFKRHFGSLTDDEIFDATYKDTEVGELKK